MVKTSTGWAVRAEGGPPSTFRTQAEAKRIAQELLRHKGGALKVHGPDGRIRETVTLGRNSMGKINAVEGQSLSASLKREFRTFDTLGLSDAERRR